MSRYTGPSWKVSRRLGISFQAQVENWHVVLAGPLVKTANMTFRIWFCSA